MMRGEYERDICTRAEAGVRVPLPRRQLVLGSPRSPSATKTSIIG